MMTTSSRCHLSPAPGSLRRIWFANAWPNLRAHCRTVSWLTMTPRAANISSTMRRPSGNRKYSQIAWLMISAGKRWPAYGERAGVVIPLGYPAHSATASPSARNLTVPNGLRLVPLAAHEQPRGLGDPRVGALGRAHQHLGI